MTVLYSILFLINRKQMTEKKTLVVGASPNTSRYSHAAVQLLTANKVPTVAFGRRQGLIDEVTIQQELPTSGEDIHTVTLYVGAKHQPELEAELIGLAPQRIIFNPGTENPAFEEKLKEKGIEAIRACTLVMLRTGQY